MLKNFKKTIPYIVFFIATLISYLLFLVYYDSTTGLDFSSKYFTYLNHFIFGNPLEVKDGQGIIYYFLISLVGKYNIKLLGPNNFNEVFNNIVQFGNLILTVLFFVGLYKYLLLLQINKNKIFYVFSVINFFPPLIYLRLTFKAEILALALFPWLLYIYNKIKLNKNLYLKIFFIIIFSIILTIKPSISMMVLVSFLFIEKETIIKNYKLIIFSFIGSLILFKFNNDYVGLSFNSFDVTGTRWDNRVNLKFFLTFDLKKFVTEPLFNNLSDSFLSILLLDTFSDYFRFFWKHQEQTNYLAFNSINISNNFHISNYLRDYIAIFLSFGMYLMFIINYKIKEFEFKRIFLLPFIGIFTLITSAAGIPVNNFDPNTADTFKVHYFSFLLVISFAFLLLTSNIKVYYHLFLIPIFVFIMGFPKANQNDLIIDLTRKYNLSEVCLINLSNNSCRNVFEITCSNIDFYNMYDTNKINIYYTYPDPIKLSKDKDIVYARNRNECYTYYDNGYRYKY